MLISAVQSSYSLKCQPVDYSEDPRALRVRACWALFHQLAFDKRHSKLPSYELWPVSLRTRVISGIIWNARASYFHENSNMAFLMNKYNNVMFVTTTIWNKTKIVCRAYKAQIYSYLIYPTYYLSLLLLWCFWGVFWLFFFGGGVKFLMCVWSFILRILFGILDAECLVLVFNY